LERQDTKRGTKKDHRQKERGALKNDVALGLLLLARADENNNKNKNQADALFKRARNHGETTGVDVVETSENELANG
jgi:hypothetical protein